MLTKQLEETKNLASEKDKAHHAATQKMHEALNRVDTLQKAHDAAKLELSEEEAAKLADDPKKMLEYMQSRTREQLQEVQSATAGQIRQLAEEVAKAIVDRDRDNESKIKALDSRYKTPAFQSLKKKYGDLFSDDQIIQMAELDGKPNPPTPPAGTTEVPTTPPPPEDHIVKARDDLFKEVLNRLEKGAT